MLTPLFRLDQDDALFIVRLHVPMLKLSDIDVCIDDGEFKLPGQVCEEDDKMRLTFDKGDLTITFLKRIYGAFFPDINIIGKLIIHNKKSIPMIHELPDPSMPGITDSDSELEWDSNLAYTSDKPYTHLGQPVPTYGFADSKSKLFLEEVSIYVLLL
ncbi:unnamed protein product [Protopolystoma xenopodis]|uniref:SHQ1-like CS domain-containing protein n=1 Tax=Protopolystoma xenopodis TaxID=117903 RepID=A0A3S5AYI0_9PLAT|nr:unnamed protein product [Protopolystoma xenopodis]